MDTGRHPGNDSVDKDLEYTYSTTISLVQMKYQTDCFCCHKKAAILLNPAIAAGCVVSYYCSYNEYSGYVSIISPAFGNHDSGNWKSEQG